MKTTMKLEKCQQAFIKQKTLRRRRNNYLANIQDQAIAGKDPVTSFSIDNMGTTGEYVVRKFFGLPVEEIPEDKPDDGVDLVVDGYTVQVKSTGYVQGKFCMTAGAEMKAQRGVLVVVREDEARIAGWLEKSTFEEKKRWEKTWREPTYAVEQRHLTSMRKWTVEERLF
jgi:hypothetical protein